MLGSIARAPPVAAARKTQTKMKKALSLLQKLTPEWEEVWKENALQSRT
jgi:hypothetical protein